MNTISTESYKRGCFGQIVKWLFIFFNIFMAIWLISYFIFLAEAPAAVTDEEKAGALIGTALGAGILLGLWCLGDIVLGLLTLLTRGSKVTVTKNIADGSAKDIL